MNPSRGRMIGAIDLRPPSGWDRAMPNPKRNARNPRCPARPCKPRRSNAAAARPASMRARQILALVHEAKAAERAARDPMLAYSMRQRLDEQLSALAERIAGKRTPSPDDLLDLALAGWYATGARPALVRAILRAGGIDPDSKNRVRGTQVSSRPARRR